MPPRLKEIDMLSKRFDLVKKMYSNDKVISVNKRDLIFNWFLEQFANYKNFSDKKSAYIYEALWKTFHEILLTENENSSHQRILIKSNSVSNLLTSISDYPYSSSWASVILTSVAIFLQTPTVNSTLIADIDSLYLLLVASLKVICKLYETNFDDVKSLKEAKNLCNVILDILENLSAPNEEEKILLLSGSLQHIALFMYIAESEKELNELCDKLAKKIISLVFNLKCKQYETLLTPVKNSCPAEKPNTYILQFIRSLHAMLMNEDILVHSITVNASCSVLNKKLLSTFLNNNKLGLHTLKVMSLFFAVAGLDIPIVMTAKSCCNSLFKENILTSEVLIMGLSHVLKACLNVPQHFKSMPVPEGYITPSIWLRGVSAALLDVKISKNKSSWLECFQSLVLISLPIIETEILPLIKTSLLNISVGNTKSKKQYCELFAIILKVHSKLHQSPKFFVKLLLALTECIKEKSGGKHLINGQIFPPVQDSIAKCVQELPFGQMISLWKIFIETFSTLENMSQAFMASKGFIFFVAQLFSTFLLHAQLFQANIPSNIQSQFNGLIENTSNEIQRNISSLKEKDPKVAPLQKSVLLLCYSIGEVKLAYTAYYGKSLVTAETAASVGIFNLSLLHNFLNEDYAPVLKTHLNSDDKTLSALVFQLLLQKFKALQFKELLSDDDKIQIKELMSVILEHLYESCSNCKSWDMDLSTINAKNYGTAYWKMFLKVSPLLLNHLDPKDFYDLCLSSLSVILQDDSCDSGAKSDILLYLKSEFFRESDLFQTAFVTAIWKKENFIYSKKRSHEDMETEENPIDRIFLLLNAYHSKSLKYTKRTPKSNKKLGSVWNEIKEISDILNAVLMSQSWPAQKLMINRTLNCIKVLNSLPLDYLLPGNQMKCIIGFSLLFFLIPQSCKPLEAVALAREISLVLTRIFEGVRSIWLFDFVASGSYLTSVVKTVESVISVENKDNHDWIEKLFEHLIHLIVRNIESLNCAEPFVLEFSRKKCSRTTLMIQFAFLKKLSQVILRSCKQQKYNETLIKISSLVIQGFIKHIKQNFQDDLSSESRAYFIKNSIHALEIICQLDETVIKNEECFELIPRIFQMVLSQSENSRDDNLRDLFLLFISKICKYREKLLEFLSENFISETWKIILSHFEEKQKKKQDIISTDNSLQESSIVPSSVSNSVCAFCSSFSGKEFFLTSDKNNLLAKDSSTNKMLSPFTLSEFEEEVLKELSVITDIEKLKEIVEELMKKMNSLGSPRENMFSLQMSISVFQCLIDGNNAKFLEPLLNQSVQTCVLSLCYVVNQTCSSGVCQVMVVTPVLDFMNFIVTGNKGFPKQTLFQSLHCVTPVSLEVQNKDYNLFVTLFTLCWKIVYNLFMHHTATILPSPAPFLSYVGKLLKAVAKAGAAEPLSKCDADTFQQVQMCAENVNRLLTVIAREKIQFSKLVPYLVADYVDTVQNITLDPRIKETILSGIHRLLDICDENSMKMQALNISYVCGEIYGNLIKNYKQSKRV